MKKLFLTAMTMALSLTTLWADEKIVDNGELPQKAIDLIQKFYPSDEITITTQDKGIAKDFQVLLESGTKIEFDGKGNLKEVETKGKGLMPKGLIPAKIKQYVGKKFPKAQVVKLEKDKKFVEIKLNNGIELKFNKDGQLVEIDN